MKATVLSRKTSFKTLFNRKLLLEFIYGLFILLFVYTGISKLSDTFNFEVELSKSPLIGNYAHVIALGLPIFELLVAIFLIVPKTKKAGLYMSTTLMILFTAYLVYMIYFTPKLPCTCGGVLSQMTWTQHLLFNIAYTALGLTGVYLQRKLESKPY